MNYDEKTKQNLQAFYSMLKNVRPDLAELISVVDETMVNPRTLCLVARHVRELCDFTRWGSVELLINDNVVISVRSVQTEKTSEPAIVRKDEVV